MTEQNFNVGAIRPVECYKEGWEMIKDQYWLMFAVTLVGMLIAGIIPIIIAGPMMCGIYLCFFDKYEGKQVDFNRLFNGFQFFAPSLVVMLIIVVPTMIVIFMIYVPFILAALSGRRMSDEELWAMLGGVLVFELFFAFIMVCIHTLMMFALPLIADKNMGAWESIMTSCKAVWKNMSGVVGLMLCGFVVAIVGYLLLCVGLYLALPLMIAANTVAYRKIFPSAAPPHSPPPPSAYPNAGFGQ
jgi:hypothetical protein